MRRAAPRVDRRITPPGEALERPEQTGERACLVASVDRDAGRDKYEKVGDILADNAAVESRS
jgi:hypothetical protein